MLLCALATLAGLVAATPATAAPPPFEIVELGAAIPEINVRGADFGGLPDGTPVAFGVSMGEPLSFNLIDLRTGRRLDTATINGETQGGPVLRAPDGTFYVTVFGHEQPGAVYRYHPAEMRLEKIGEQIGGDSRVYRLAAAEDDGTIYFTTYPRAKLIAYSPETGEMRDYGSVGEGIDAGSGVAVVGDEVWIGTRPVARLLAVNRQTGQVREIEIPPQYTQNTSIIGRLEKRGDRVFVHLGPTTGFEGTLYYNLETRTWSTTGTAIGTAAGMTSPTQDHLVYFISGRALYSYHLETDEISPTGLASTGAQAGMQGSQRAFGINLVDIGGRTAVAGLTNTGTLWHYFPDDGSGHSVQGQVFEAAARIVGFDVGPDGNVYIGAKMGADAIGRINPHNDQVERLSGPTQAEGVGGSGNTILIGRYPGAWLYVGDLSKPWRWGENPREVQRFGSSAPHYQNRLWAIEPVGDRFALASIPVPGQTGGALIIFDPATEAHQVYRNVVEGHSLIDLTYRDGLLYVGTAVQGGEGTEAVAPDARLFIWDVAANRKIWEESVLPGAPNLSALTWAPDGMLWGMSETGEVFEFDPGTRRVTRQHRVADTSKQHIWGMHSSLVYDEENDGFWGTVDGMMFFLDRKTLDSEIVDREHTLYRLVRSGNGNIYAAGNSLVYRVKVLSD